MKSWTIPWLPLHKWFAAFVHTILQIDQRNFWHFAGVGCWVGCPPCLNQPNSPRFDRWNCSRNPVGPWIFVRCWNSGWLYLQILWCLNWGWNWHDLHLDCECFAILQLFWICLWWQCCIHFVDLKFLCSEILWSWETSMKRLKLCWISLACWGEWCRFWSCFWLRPWKSSLWGPRFRLMALLRIETFPWMKLKMGNLKQEISCQSLSIQKGASIVWYSCQCKPLLQKI